MFKFIFAFLFAILFISNCANRVVRDVSDIETVTGVDWAARDLKIVGEKMADSIASSGLANNEKYIMEKPRWMLSNELVNETSEHINTRVLMEKVRTQLIKRRLARFVDDRALADILREQKLQSSQLFDTSKAARVGKLVGAKLLLRGRISDIRKRIDNIRIVYYNITMQAVDLETREIIWTDEAEIQRLQEN